jgi:integrase/recombinase XerD
VIDPDVAVRVPPADEFPLEAEEFITWLSAERGRSINTLQAYRRDLRAYCGWLGASGVDLVGADESDIHRYVARLRDEGKLPASIARALVAIRGLHRFMADEGLTGVDPGADVEPPRVPAGVPKPLSEDEVVALIGAVVGDDAIARRDRAILEVLYGTGIRISELVGLSLVDVDLDGALLRVFGKGAKERIVPLGRFARQAIEHWFDAGGRPALAPEHWARRADAEAVFLNARGGRLSRQGVWGIVRGHGDTIGLGDRLTPHVLRHSCATHMVDHGADIRAVQELLGHASIRTTQVYTKVSTERLWEVYEAAHPRARASGRHGDT